MINNKLQPQNVGVILGGILGKPGTSFGQLSLMNANQDEPSDPSKIFGNSRDTAGFHP